MNPIEIDKTNLYFKRIKNVLTTRLSDQKKFHVNGRHSDAFVLVTVGSCTYTFEDNSELTTRKGDILYLAHNAVYTMEIHSRIYQSVYCDFEFDCTVPRKSMIYQPVNISAVENLFRKLMSSSRSTGASAFTDCMSILYTIYGVILETTNDRHTESSVRHQIADAHKYITANYKDDTLSVTLLAERANMSEVYFRRLFKDQYDISPSRFITDVRLKKAKEFMKYPFLSMKDCALQSGFSSLQYFCRVFKKETGMTPTQYRMQKDKL